MPFEKSEPIALKFPQIWKSAEILNPYAEQVNQAVLRWLLERKIVSPADDLYRTAVNIQPGYFVGYPFPTIAYDRLYDIGCLWTIELLWDDVDVEATLEDQARATQEVLNLFLLNDENAPPIISPIPTPTDLVREVLATMQHKQGDNFIRHHAKGMHLWYRAARKEQVMAKKFRAGQIDFEFNDFFDNRCVTVGATAGMSIDYVYNYDIPDDFHQLRQIETLKRLAAAVCAIGNDVCSVRRDIEKNWPSSITVRMKLEGMTLDDALYKVTCDHLDYCRQFDQIAAQLLSESVFTAAYPFAGDYIHQMRVYTSGVTLWETNSPRYTRTPYIRDGVQWIPEAVFVD